MEEYFGTEEEPLRVKTFENLQALDGIISSGRLRVYGYELTITKCNNLLRRFKRWANKVVTRKSGIESLDHRLRESPCLVRQLRESLYDVHLRLDDIQGLARADDYRVSGQAGPRQSECRNLYSTLAREVDKLEILSKQALNSTTYNREMDMKIFTRFNARDIQHVRTIYPQADEELVEWLAASVSRRRAILRHRQQQNKPDPLMNEMVSDKPPWLVHLNRDYRTLEHDVISSVPWPTTTLKYDMPFECPYCFCTIAVTSRGQWVKHILHDLMPYQCIYPDCPERDRWLTTWVEWSDHQTRDHHQDRICPLCKKEAKYFVLGDHIADHLERLALFVLCRPNVDHKALTVPSKQLFLLEPAPIPQRRRKRSVPDLGLCYYSAEDWDEWVGSND